MGGGEIRKELGSDLLSNAVAAYENYSKPSIIIDFGTALTFLAIDINGDIKGVIISPGVKTALDSLIDKTAQLPSIKLEYPKFILGHNTKECIQSGIVFGYQCMVEGIIEKINIELSEKHFVIATGGLSHIIKKLTKHIDVYDKLHTIEGIRILGLQQE